MRVRFDRIRVAGFRSILTELELDLSKGAFVMVQGENRLEPELGANGAGKSTLFDALVWGLYGKSARGLKAGSIAHWEASATWVVVELRVGKRPVVVRRTWNPNALTIAEGGGEPKIAEQNEVDQLIGVDYWGFLAVVLMGQFNRVFFDLSPTEKLAVFSDVLKLDLWVQASEAAKAALKEAAGGLTQVEHELATLGGKLTSNRQEIERMTIKADGFAEELKKEVARLARELKQSVKVVEEATSKHQAALKAFKAARATKVSLESELLDKDKERDQLRDKIADLNADLRVLLSEAEEVARQIKRMQRLKGGECLHCGQKVSKEHADQVLVTLVEEQVTLKTKIEQLTSQIDRLTENLKELDVEMRGLDARLTETERAINSCQRAERKAKDEETFAITTRDTLTAALKKAEDQTNPFDDLIAEVEDRIRSLTKQIKEVEEERALSRAECEVYEFWAKEFKVVRLWLITEALKEFELEVNNCLPELGLPGWKVVFDVERETKSGSVSRGFTVIVKCPDAPDGVAWESWSGGETQRLRIAGAIGLANLIRSRTGFNPSLEVWDEPTAHLSGEGIDDLLEFFRHRVEQSKRSIWLVDHRSLNHGGFDRRVRIIKDHRGSTMEEPQCLATWNQ